MVYESMAQERERLLAAIYAVREKACVRCGVVKPNDLETFCNKLFYDRYTQVPADVCKACAAAKIANRWRKQKWERYDYECFKNQEAIRRARRERGDDPDGTWSVADHAAFDALRPPEPDCPRPTPGG